MTELTDIIYDVNLTKEALKKTTRMSWSKFDNFRTCKGWWFTNYVLQAPRDIVVTPTIREDSRAIPGTVIQKVMEVFINSRIYSRPGMSSMQDLLDWLTTNTRAVFYLSKFSVEQQLQPEFENRKGFWNNKYGSLHRQVVINNYNLDPEIKEVNLSFIDRNTFRNIYETEEKLLDKLCSLYPAILQMFIDQELTLDRIMSEIPLNIEVGDMLFTGSIDFLYNTRQKSTSYFSSIGQLEDGYFIFDGKYNFSSYTKEDQLQFYAFLLFLRTRKIPGRMALYSWTENKLKEFDFNMDFRLKIEDGVNALLDTCRDLEQKFENKTTPHGLFFQDELFELNPSNSNCQFCLALPQCPAAKEKGVTCMSDFADKMFAKKAAKQMISLLDPESNGNITL